MLTYILQTYVVIQITSTFWCGPCSLLELQAWLAPLKIIGTWTRDVAVFKTQLKFTLSVHAQSEIVIVTFEAVLMFLLLTFFWNHPCRKTHTKSTLSGRAFTKSVKRSNLDPLHHWAGGASKTESRSHWFCHLCGLWGVRRFFQTREEPHFFGLGRIEKSCQSTNPWINSTESIWTWIFFVLFLKCRCLIHVSTVAFRIHQIHRTDSGSTEGSPKGSTGGQKALWKGQNFIQKSQNLGIELVKNFKMGKKKSTSRGKKKWLDSCATPRKAPHSFGSLSCHSHWFGHQDTNDSREGPALLGRSEPVEIEYGELPGRIHKNWVPKQIRKLGYVYTIPFYTSIFQIHLKWKVILNSHQLQTIFSFGASWSC